MPAKLVRSLLIHAGGEEAAVDGRVMPVTKRAASEARKTAAPASSSTLPKRPMGVRARNSFPRSELSSRFMLSSVRKTPGAMALTQTPCLAHSMASDCVSERTADLLAE